MSEKGLVLQSIATSTRTSWVTKTFSDFRCRPATQRPGQKIGDGNWLVIDRNREKGRTIYENNSAIGCVSTFVRIFPGLCLCRSCDVTDGYQIQQTGREKACIRFGFSIMKAKPIEMPGSSEDPHLIYDKEAGKWRVLVCTDKKGFPAAIYESDQWDGPYKMIGRRGDKQVLYDVIHKKVVGQWGTPAIFPNPEGDISLSPSGQWFVNGHKKGDRNYYTVYRRHDGAFARSEGIFKGSYGGDIRIDPAPRWNRTNNAVLVPGIADNKTRQLFMIKVVTNRD